jgi:hypothetical protein
MLRADLAFEKIRVHFLRNSQIASQAAQNYKLAENLKWPFKTKACEIG